MCGVYTLHHKKGDLIARFHVPRLGDEIDPQYKIAPSQSVDIVRLSHDSRILDTARWGLVPFWAKDTQIGRKLFNARAEGLGDKPAFRSALLKRRCLIPADGFYEWDKLTRQPMYFRRRDDQLFAFAGLWETWRDPASSNPQPLHSFTIITTEANETVRKVHDRMPVMLLEDAESAWLGEDGDAKLGQLRDLLQPYPEELMEGYWVSKEVNGRGEHGPEAIVPVERIGESAELVSAAAQAGLGI